MKNGFSSFATATDAAPGFSFEVSTNGVVLTGVANENLKGDEVVVVVVVVILKPPKEDVAGEVSKVFIEFLNEKFF